MAAKVGVISASIVISIVVGIPHCDGLSGVKVYVVVPALAVLIVEGLHVPVIPLSEVVDKVGAAVF